MVISFYYFSFVSCNKHRGRSKNKERFKANEETNPQCEIVEEGQSFYFLQKGGFIMAHVSKAVFMVVEYIISNELYNFQSLTNETQERLIEAYGSNFEVQVNKALGF